MKTEFEKYLQIQKIMANTTYFKEKIKKESSNFDVINVGTEGWFANGDNTVFITFKDMNYKLNPKRMIFRAYKNKTTEIGFRYENINGPNIGDNRYIKIKYKDNPNDVDDLVEYTMNYKDKVETEGNYKLIDCITVDKLNDFKLFVYITKDIVFYYAMIKDKIVEISYKHRQMYSAKVDGNVVNFLSLNIRYSSLMKVINDNFDNHAEQAEEIEIEEEKEEPKVDEALIIKGSESLEPYLEYLRTKVYQAMNKGAIKDNDVILTAYIPELNNIIPHYDTVDDEYKKKIIKSIESIERKVREKTEDIKNDERFNAEIDIDTLDQLLNQ